MIEPVYSRNWTANLRGLEDFTILIGFDEQPLKDLCSYRYHTYFVSTSACVYIPLMERTLRNPCSFARIFQNVMKKTAFSNARWGVAKLGASWHPGKIGEKVGKILKVGERKSDNDF